MERHQKKSTRLIMLGFVAGLLSFGVNDAKCIFIPSPEPSEVEAGFVKWKFKIVKDEEWSRSSGEYVGSVVLKSSPVTWTGKWDVENAPPLSTQPNPPKAPTLRRDEISPIKAYEDAVTNIYAVVSEIPYPFTGMSCVIELKAKMPGCTIGEKDGKLGFNCPD